MIGLEVEPMGSGERGVAKAYLTGRDSRMKYQMIAERFGIEVHEFSGDLLSYFQKILEKIFLSLR